MGNKDDFRRYLHLHVGGCCEFVCDAKRLSEFYPRARFTQPYRIMRRETDGNGLDVFHVLVGFANEGGDRPAPHGYCYKVHAQYLSPVGNRFGLFETVVETGKGGRVSQPVGIESYSDGLYTLTSGHRVPSSKLRPACERPTAWNPDPFRPQTLFPPCYTCAAGVVLTRGAHRRPPEHSGGGITIDKNKPSGAGGMKRACERKGGRSINL